MSCDCNTLVVGEAGPQGPQGLAGINGTNGTNGVNAFTTLSASFTQPAINSSVTFSVAENRWIAIGQTIYISNAGFYRVTSLGGSPYTSVTAVLVKTDGVVNPASVSSGLKVSPSAGATYVDPLSSLTVNGTSNLDGAVTINESGAAVDFRVESDTQTHVLFTKGSTNRVGILTAAPSATLDVNGTVKVQSTAELMVGGIVNSSQADSDFSVRTQGSTNTLYVDASTNRVGLFTSTPQKVLDVAGDAQIVSLLVNPSGANNTSSFKVLGASSGVPLNVDSTNNRVGIKTASPTAELDVVGSAKVSGTFNITGLSTLGTLNVTGASTLASLGVTGAATVGTTLDVTGTSTLGVLNAGASTLTSLNVTNDLAVNTNVLKVDTTNNRVGINKTSPAVALDVVGQAAITGNLTVDTNVFAVDTTNSRVGINTASPSVELDVNGSVKASDYRITTGGAAAKLTKFLYGSGSGSLTLNADNTSTISLTVTGAVVGDFVLVTYSSIPTTTPNLITLFGYVDSTNNVTVVVSNGSSTAIANQSYAIKVLVIGSSAT